MSVNGVSTSPLLERAILGDQTRVPIGAPVITNQKSKNSKDVQALITGTDLTEPLLSQFEVFGQDGKKTSRNSNRNSLQYSERTNNNDRMIAEYAFDADTGALVLVRRNKQEERIFGFMRQSDFGVGPTGPRGPAGKDGKDGYEGRDGAKGSTGCEGKEGKPGEPGNVGNEGNPGTIGRPGPDGCEGTTGDRGVVGPTGRNGYEGSRGLTGPECSKDLKGADGPVGNAFGKGVLFGAASMSNPLAAIVGLDDDGIDATPPTNGWDGSSKPPSTSVPTNPPPTPTASASVSVCRDLGNVKNSCGNTVNAWYSTFANYDAPNGAKGLSTIPLARQTIAWIPHSIVLCGTLAKGGEYTFEMSTPPGVASTLFLNCGIYAQVDYPGGTFRGTKTLDAITSIRLRFLPNADRIPCWCSLKIFNAATGALLYSSGQNAASAGLSGDFAAAKIDPNWGGNAAVKHYL